MLAAVVIMMMTAGIIVRGQEQEPAKEKFRIGFNGMLPRGITPSTALTNGGTPIEKSYGLGVIIQRRVYEGLSLFFDINMHNYNVFLASQGSDVQSSWTVAQSAEHWDEPGAPHIQYVHNLPTDVHFDMTATGMRLGGKYVFGGNKVRPWAGLGFGFYQWTANYLSKDKSSTYGFDSGYTTGLTYLGGVDITIMDDTMLSIFADLASPVAEYTIEGLFYDQWDITDWDAHIMGQYRFGISLFF